MSWKIISRKSIIYVGLQTKTYFIHSGENFHPRLSNEMSNAIVKKNANVGNCKMENETRNAKAPYVQKECEPNAKITMYRSSRGFIQQICGYVREMAGNERGSSL